ncbi:imidazole glycerol phosphate synthase subunit HisF [Pseudodesulfovibrio tunisiensis]|uniref:imidazole glycerol phosphate synthase subunit HisF n=1 Tax=Pseudodesulfovibrio tunisiensis TaxID=463192 RepID=UPI001FB4C591|nr:HisA/HisF-related TIM barrel protein [Pseudodesulfovibrio tunisiensis]
MLKHRIAAKLLIAGGICVQSRQFRFRQPIGKPEIAISHLNTWGVDEIVCLHADNAGRFDADDFKAIARYARHCLVPLSIGGGFGSVEQMCQALHCGADKIVVNTLLHTNPDVISAATERFGRQCMIISVDVRRENDNWCVCTHGGRQRAPLSLKETLTRAEACGAGEILLQSMDREGTGTGLDRDLLKEISGLTNVPVILGGGYGRPSHLVPVFSAGISAVAIGNALHHTEHSVCLIKAFLDDREIPVRHDLPLRYGPKQIDSQGRPAGIDERELLKLRFQGISPMVI